MAFPEMLHVELIDFNMIKRKEPRVKKEDILKDYGVCYKERRYIPDIKALKIERRKRKQYIRNRINTHNRYEGRHIYCDDANIGNEISNIINIPFVYEMEYIDESYREYLDNFKNAYPEVYTDF